MLRWLVIFAVSSAVQAPTTPAAGNAAPSRPPEKRIATEGTRKAGEQQTKANQGDTENPQPTPVNVQASADDNHQKTDAEQQNLDIQRKLEWFTGGLVIVGMMQAGTMIWQAWLLRGTLGEIHVQAGHMKTQTEFLKDSVQAAKDSAEAALISSKAMIAADRPWLLIRRVSSRKEEYMGSLTINACNVGKSPAEVLFSHFEAGSSPPTETPRENILWLNFNVVHTSWVAPGGKHYIGQDFPNKAPSDNIWYVGIVKYRGPLRDEVYESRFCFSYNRKSGAELIMAGPKGYNHYT